MLGKVIKFEMKSTGRLAIPVALCSLVCAVLLRISIAGGSEFFLTITAILYGCLVVAMYTILFVTLGSGVEKRLFGDEGYFMLTLPVSVHQILWGKVLANMVWILLATICAGLGGMILAMDKTFFPTVLKLLSAVFSIPLDRTVEIIKLVGVTLVAVVISYLAFIFFLFACIAIGRSFHKFKETITIALIVICLFISGTISGKLAVAGIQTSWQFDLFINAVIAAVCYFITTYFLTNRLNLE